MIFSLYFSLFDALFHLEEVLYHLDRVTHNVYRALAVIDDLNGHLDDLISEFVRPKQALKVKRKAIDLAS